MWLYDYPGEIGILDKATTPFGLIHFWVQAALVLLVVAIVLVVIWMVLPFSSRNSDILLESDSSGNWDIYRMDISKNIAINLTRHPAADHDPCWSVQTRQIAFTSDRDGDNATEIYVMDEMGKHVERVTPRDGIYWNPAWLSDGYQLSFVFNYGNIQVLDRATNQQHFVAYGFAPKWSADGSHITYAADQPHVDANMIVFTAQADGRNAHNLTAGRTNDWEPAWSPDGHQIAFVSTRDGNAEIYVTNAACENDSECGNVVKRLTDNPAVDQYPSWSPDGQEIVFESNRDGSQQIYVMSADGSDVRQITHDKNDHAVPVWMG